MDFLKIIMKIATEAMAGSTGMAISPLLNADRKRGAKAIMLKQFRRAVSEAIVRENAKH